MKRKVLLVNSIYLSLYLVFGTLYYLFANTDDLFANHPVFASIYVGFVAVHAAIVLAAVLFQWWGYAARKRGPLVFASLLCVIAGLELVLLLVPAGAMLLSVILNAVAGRPEPPASA